MTDNQLEGLSTNSTGVKTIDIIPVVKSHTVSEFLPVIPSFDGNSSFSAFIDKFNSIADYCKWDDNDKILALSLRLIGEAQEFVSTQRELRYTKDFKLLVKSLRERFETKSNMASYITKLTQAYQLPCENARQFFSRLEGISYNCIPGNGGEEFESYREQLLLSAAKQGLRVELLRGIASTALDSYNEFKKHTLTFEENFKLIEPMQLAAAIQAKSEDNTAAKIDDLNTKIEQLTLTISKMQTKLDTEQNNREYREKPRQTHSARNRYQNQSEKKCFNGKKLGHLAKNCPVPYCNYCKRIGHSVENCF
nr:uncharacterized protein LOC122273073 [Parasteatoda tepidariorum]